MARGGHGGRKRSSLSFSQSRFPHFREVSFCASLRCTTVASVSLSLPLSVCPCVSVVGSRLFIPSCVSLFFCASADGLLEQTAEGKGHTAAVGLFFLLLRMRVPLAHVCLPFSSHLPLPLYREAVIYTDHLTVRGISGPSALLALGKPLSLQQPVLGYSAVRAVGAGGQAWAGAVPRRRAVVRVFVLAHYEPCRPFSAYAHASTVFTR